MVLMGSYHDCYVVSTISLCLAASQRYGTIVSLHNLGVNCVSLQFGSFVSIYTSVGKVFHSKQFGGIFFVYPCNLEVRCIMVLMVQHIP